MLKRYRLEGPAGLSATALETAAVRRPPWPGVLLLGNLEIGDAGFARDLAGDRCALPPSGAPDLCHGSHHRCAGHLGGRVH